MTFIARIFVNLCKIVEKWPKLRNNFWLQFDFSFLKTNSKFEKNILLWGWGRATLPLWFEPKHNYVCPAVWVDLWASRPMVGLEDLSIDVSITNVGLILTKLRWFQLFVISQNSNFELFWKKIQIFGFPCCSTRKDLSIDVSITNVGDKDWYQRRQGNFSGYRQTDNVLEFAFGNMSAHKKISSHSPKLMVSCWSLNASPEDINV